MSSIVKLLFAGDFCPIGRNAYTIANKEYKILLGDIKGLIREADLRIVNLECPLTDIGQSLSKSGPNIKADKGALDFLVAAKVNLCTMANNHILDFSADGLLSTIDACKSKGIDIVGAGSNLDEARKPFILNIKNRKIGILNFAENEFCAAKKDQAGANPINLISNFHDIQQLKKEVNHIVVIVHGGREHYQLPTPKVRERYRFFIDAGADAVVGHHTHCYSGYEMYNQKPIFYSLGNFIFDYKDKYQKGTWTEAFVLMLKFDENKISFELTPFFQGKKENPNIVLMQGEDKLAFENKIMQLNTEITDDSLFFTKWKEYLKTQKRYYTSMLTTSNKYIRYAKSKGWLPSLGLTREHRNVLLNIFRCETHHEIMTNILEELYDNDER